MVKYEFNHVQKICGFFEELNVINNLRLGWAHWIYSRCRLCGHISGATARSSENASALSCAWSHRLKPKLSRNPDTSALDPRLAWPTRWIRMVTLVDLESMSLSPVWSALVQKLWSRRRTQESEQWLRPRRNWKVANDCWLHWPKWLQSWSLDLEKSPLHQHLNFGHSQRHPRRIEPSQPEWWFDSTNLLVGWELASEGSLGVVRLSKISSRSW